MEVRGKSFDVPGWLYLIEGFPLIHRSRHTDYQLTLYFYFTGEFDTIRKLPTYKENRTQKPRSIRFRLLRLTLVMWYRVNQSVFPRSSVVINTHESA